MDCRDIEWAAFLFNAMGEDGSYINDLRDVQKKIKDSESKEKSDIGGAVITFLNHWRSRASNNLEGEIEKWYDQNRDELDNLSCCLSNVHLKDTEGIIKNLYRTLVSINGIGDTIASKILHILKPDLFIPWDIPIRMWYHSQKIQENNKQENTVDEYFLFLKEMQSSANSLTGQNKNFVSDLNSKVRRLYGGNLKKLQMYESKLASKPNKELKEKIESYETMVDFMKKGKTIAKYLDEYNWITITNGVKVPPEWNPGEK